jgi:DNA-directed RNA polymerase specialized sigma24 family protein
LTEVEVQEVVQEVMIAVVKQMPSFTYEPGKDSLKGWLLGVTRWKVADQFRKRKRAGEASHREDSPPTANVNRDPDPNSIDLEAIWDAEGRKNLLPGLDRIKQQVNPAHYEMYHLHAVQRLSPRDTAIALAVSAAAVHMANFRVGRLVKAEIRRLSNPSPL